MPIAWKIDGNNAVSLAGNGEKLEQITPIAREVDETIAISLTGNGTNATELLSFHWLVKAQTWRHYVN